MGAAASARQQTGFAVEDGAWAQGSMAVLQSGKEVWRYHCQTEMVSRSLDTPTGLWKEVRASSACWENCQTSSEATLFKESKKEARRGTRDTLPGWGKHGLLQIPSNFHGQRQVYKHSN